MASKHKNSLVENINRRRRSGKSRPKSRSSVSKDAYDEMQKGWPHSGKKKAAKKKLKTKRASSAKATTKAKHASSKRRTAKKKTARTSRKSR